jgi:hypothetical protein
VFGKVVYRRAYYEGCACGKGHAPVDSRYGIEPGKVTAGFMNNDRSPHDPQEVENRFKDFPEALSATLEIAERCKFDLPGGKSSMPSHTLYELDAN